MKEGKKGKTKERNGEREKEGKREWDAGGGGGRETFIFLKMKSSRRTAIHAQGM